VKSKWPTCLALAAIIALAAWLRLHRLGDHSLWVDEGFSVHFAHTPWTRFWRVAWSREANMLLYYLLLRPWAHFAVTEFQLRLLSVIFGLAGVVMIYVLGRELFSRATGLIAAALLAVHAFHVYYSQEARSYPLTIFLLLLSAWLLARLVRQPESRRNHIGYAVAAALAFYAHIFALLVIVSHWIAFWLWSARAKKQEGSEEPASRFLFPAIRLFVWLAFPLLIFAIFKNKGQLDWIPPLTPTVFMQGLFAITGKGGASLLVLYLVLASIGAACALCSPERARRFATLLMISWALFPIAVFMLYSLHKPLFLDRYLVLVVPAFVLLAAEGIMALAQLRSALRLLWIPALALLLALSLRATWRQYDAIKWLDWRAATHFISANTQPGDALCFTAPGSESFWYYWQREGRISWDDFPATYYQNGTLCTLPFSELGAPRGNSSQRVWLVTTIATPEQRQWILGILAHNFGAPQVRQEFARPPLKLTVELLPGSSTNR
jgi:mannosyltransferase